MGTLDKQLCAIETADGQVYLYPFGQDIAAHLFHTTDFAAMYLNDLRIMGKPTEGLRVVPVDDLREWVVKFRDAGITDVAEHTGLIPIHQYTEDWLFEIDDA